MTMSSPLMLRASLDHFYASAVHEGAGDTELLRAGFFDDGLACRVSALPGWDMLSTPVEHVVSGLAALAGDGRVPVVLLTTGAFDPPHAGHVGMMRRAKTVMEQAGFSVVGGYLSPSHDGYVGTKRTGALSAPERLNLCRELCRQEGAGDWLSVDAWEALCLPVAVNFTDVMSRMREYLRVRLGCGNLEVAYVCGSDNAMFHKAFLGQGYCVCVRRSGSAGDAGWQAIREQHQLLSGPVALRIILADTFDDLAVLSSTRVRLEGWCNPYTVQESTMGLTYLVRDELEAALPASWLDKGAAAAYAVFVDTLMNGLGNAVPKGIDVVRVRLDAQMGSLGDALGQVRASLGSDLPTLSLDPFMDGDANLGVSRLFSLSSDGLQPLRLIARPGLPDIEEQVRAIPTGNYLLVEDDVASGLTLRSVVALLPPRVCIKGVLTLSGTGLTMGVPDNRIGPGIGSCHARDETTSDFQASCPVPSYGPVERVWDVVDARDFLLGSRHGGLVSLTPGGCVARVPYLPPYVNLVSRARLQPLLAYRLGLLMWKANLDFFSGPRADIRVCDADTGFLVMAMEAGWHEDLTLRDVCLHHLSVLSFR